jgi:hypothetical protein
MAPLVEFDCTENLSQPRGIVDCQLLIVDFSDRRLCGNRAGNQHSYNVSSMKSAASYGLS